MKTFALPMALIGTTMLLVSTQSSPAQTPLRHTWVASTGMDTDNCDRPTPCASFGGAFVKTAAGGEITCVDSGNYGGLPINKSITINCEAAIGSNTVAGGTSLLNIHVTVAATDLVTLRGLDFDGLGLTSGGSGVILFDGAGVLHVEKVKINNLLGTFNGIQFFPNGPAKLFVSDSSITDMGTSGITAGIYTKPNSGVTASVLIERTRVENNAFGIVADGTSGGLIRGVVRDSVVSGNTNNGITISGAKRNTDDR